MLHDKCLKYVKEVYDNIDTVQYLVKNIEWMGKRMDLSDIKCVSYNDFDESSHQAGYLWENVPLKGKKGQIILNEEHISTKEDAERAIRHELIHAYDSARGKIDPNNCLHQACSEIRAARLSGDCFARIDSSTMYFDNFFLGAKCVENRAIRSVESNPSCINEGLKAVNKVWKTCYYDYEPYVAPLYMLGSYKNID